MKEQRYRKPTKRSRYYVAPALWNHAISFCRCFPLWVAELSACDSSRAIRYDLDKVQTSGDNNPTEQLGMRRAELQRKVDIINTSAAAVTDSDPMQKYIIMGVTHGLSFEVLEHLPLQDTKLQGIPCSRNTYHAYRRKMIYNVAMAIS